MRKTIIFDEDITADGVNNLINQIHGLEEVDLFFSTDGGNPNYMKALINFLNFYEGNLRVFLNHIVASAGVTMLTEFKGAKNIDELDILMLHATDRFTGNTRRSKAETICIERDKENLQKDLKFLKKFGLSEKELLKYQAGKDVILSNKRVRQLKIKNLF